jgi:hypothetical protein
MNRRCKDPACPLLLLPAASLNTVRTFYAKTGGERKLSRSPRRRSHQSSNAAGDKNNVKMPFAFPARINSPVMLSVRGGQGGEPADRVRSSFFLLRQ